MTSARLRGDEPGCVLRIETGVAVVLTSAGECRASYAARMLARVARDPACAPQAGDWVSVRRWSDGRSTIEDCLTPGRVERREPEAPGVVVDLRSRVPRR